MTSGMMWFTDSKGDLLTEIRKAADYFSVKYHKKPNLCLVHPSMLKGSLFMESMTIRAYRPVLPGHLWIGVEEEDKKA